MSMKYRRAIASSPMWIPAYWLILKLPSGCADPWLRIRQYEDCEKAEHPDDPSVVHDLLQALRATSEFGFSS